jgi:tetratricopeptide (TPR) repeat protein
LAGELERGLQWKINTGSVTAFLPDLLLVALFALCWWFRKAWGWHVLLGLGCFAVALFPALGFFDAQFMTMWQVSDHLQYIPMIALIALASAALASWLKPDIFRVASFLIILTLCGLGYQRTEAFRTEESLMRDTIAKNPAAWPAHTDLGVVFAKQGNIAGAINEFKKALLDQPGNQDIHRDLSHAYLAQGKLAEAETEASAALKLNPGDPILQRDDADVLEALGENDEAVEHLLIASALKPEVETQMDLATLFYMSGNPNQAARQLRRALAINPDQPEALKTLAWILATSANDSLRNGNEALRDARRACQLTDFKHPEIVAVLGAAYAETGQFSRAIAAAELAGRLATQTGDQRWMAISSQLLTRFRANKPWRE